MKRTFQVLLEWVPDDKVWVKYVPHLDFLSTFGDTLEHTREAILGYLKGIDDLGLEAPRQGHSLELTEIDVSKS